ncbi:hypothetical protein GW7_09688, partial [Heterocephalus glaber]
CSAGWPQICDLPASVSLTAGITGMHHHVRGGLPLSYIPTPFIFYFETRSHYIAQVILKLVGSSDPPA